VTVPGQPLPPARPGRVVVEPVAPLVDGGTFPAKATVGEAVTVVADLFADGHDVVAAAMRFRTGRRRWTEVPMDPVGNDRWEARFVPDRLGSWQYQVVGWIDHLETWRRGTAAKLSAGQDVAVELEIGARMIDAVLDGAPQDGDPVVASGDRRRLDVLRVQLVTGEFAGLFDESAADECHPLFWRAGKRAPVSQLPVPLELQVDPLRARFSAWYEFFPRSPVHPATGHATLGDAIDRVDRVAEMGFDVLYLPPVHPIGVSARKGRNNAVEAKPGDVGSPWATGGVEGGHTAVHPELGTVADVTALAEACRQRGIELALDLAFQCTPDHPWVTEHPDWYVHRPDGTIQYAENPPKRYQDIYPLDFESTDWRGLWRALRDVVRFWVDAGVTIFRVDNPHTKAFAFWQWMIADIRSFRPDVIFLAEAFTRPRVMERLAKIGFNQSYTYFTWRQQAWELAEYGTELAGRTVDYFRPNFWPNTPDILTEQLQRGSRATFVSRAVLAATMSPSWGIYGPAFELLEQAPREEGSEEYLDSEKYQLRQWRLDDPASLAPLVVRLNEIRRAEPALAQMRTFRAHRTDTPDLFCFSKTDPIGDGAAILVVVNLDGENRQAGFVDVDLYALGLPYESDYDLVDLLGGATFHWHGAHNFVDLSPTGPMAHILRVEAR